MFYEDNFHGCLLSCNRKDDGGGAGEMPFTVNVVLPVASVNASGVTVATVGRYLWP